MSKLKTAVVCIARLEGNYIREFIDHYKSIGFSNVIFCDNNHDDDNEDIVSIIKDYIDDGFIIYEDYRNKVGYQMKCYDEIYKKYGKQFNALCFCDVDEHLILNKHKNITEFLESFPSDWEQIVCNWAQYGDNGQIYVDYSKPLKERFTEHRPNVMSQYNFVDEMHVKCIVKGGLPQVTFYSNPHVATTPLITYHASGYRCSNSPFQRVDHTVAYFKHYCTKSLQEYCENKLRRGSGDRDYKTFLMTYGNRYFKINDWTEEKEKWLNEHGYSGV